MPPHPARAYPLVKSSLPPLPSTLLVLSSNSGQSLLHTPIPISIRILRRISHFHSAVIANPAPTMSSTSQPAQPGTTASPPVPATATIAETNTTTETFTVHYFATAASYTNKNTESLPAPLPLSRLFPLLEERYPGISDKVLRSCGVSLEGEYVDIDSEEDKKRVILSGQEVAVIPPVSSG